jgi:membrane associated rhomboid family serine protease
MFYFFYYFPLGLDVKPRRPTPASWAIAAACIVAYLVQRFLPLWFWANYDAFVFVPAHPSPASLLLNAYFHGGWLHLASNLVSLLVFAPVLEDRLGTRRFVVLYHCANVLANLTQGSLVLLLQPDHADYGVLGASGAIAGLMGLFCVRLYFARLRVGYWAFLPLQALNRWGASFVPSGFAIAMWFGIQLGMLLLQREGVAGGIACGSHLGGLLGGVGLGLLLGLPAQARAEQHLHRGRGYLNQAQWYAAQGEFIEYVRRQPIDDIGHLELARTYRLTGRHPQADQHYRSACELAGQRKRWDQIEAMYVEAEKGNGHFCLAPGQQLQLARLRERALQPKRRCRRTCVSPTRCRTAARRRRRCGARRACRGAIRPKPGACRISRNASRSCRSIAPRKISPRCRCVSPCCNRRRREPAPRATRRLVPNEFVNLFSRSFRARLHSGQALCTLVGPSSPRRACSNAMARRASPRGTTQLTLIAELETSCTGTSALASAVRMRPTVPGWLWIAWPTTDSIATSRPRRSFAPSDSSTGRSTTSA